MKRRQRLRKAALLLLWLGTMANKPALAQSVTAGEDDIRAAMVSHLALFVEWPPEKMDPAHPELRVCLLGADPISYGLETAFRNAGSGLKAVVVRVTMADKLDACHILYVGAGMHDNLGRLSPMLQQASVLTVSERPLSVAASEIVGLPLQDSHIGIQINLNLAQHSRLVISSRLLRLASLVQKP